MIKVVIVTGSPGVGKSVLAQRLARDCHLPLLEKDIIKEPLFDVLAARASRVAAGAPPLASRELSDLAFAALFALARRQLAVGCSVLLEGNFRAGEHEPDLRALAGAALLVQVYCHCAEALRLERLAVRVSDPHRHRAHRERQGVTVDGRAAAARLAVPGVLLDYDTGGADGNGYAALRHAIETAAVSA